MPTSNALQLTGGIIASFVERNKVGANELPELIGWVHQAISAVGEEQPAAIEETRKATPAQIKRSIRPAALISFEDG
jgi:predicted transcriptional regulator